MTSNANSTASMHFVPRQICNQIPGHALGEIVRNNASEDLVRTFDY